MIYGSTELSKYTFSTSTEFGIISAPGRLENKRIRNPTKMKEKIRAPSGRQLLEKARRSNRRPGAPIARMPILDIFGVCKGGMKGETMDGVPYNRERRSVFACTTLVARVTVFCPQKLFSNKRKKIILKIFLH